MASDDNLTHSKIPGIDMVSKADPSSTVFIAAPNKNKKSFPAGDTVLGLILVSLYISMH